jgi:uncharacterized protein
VYIANKPKIIIAAIASRPYVKAAVEAGFDVVAIDAFVDVDTQLMVADCYQIDLNKGQLDIYQLTKVLDSLDLQLFAGFCYGAGFEQNPEILLLINERIPIIGNLTQVVEKCKNPDYFFALCDSLRVPHPPIATDFPLKYDGWLQKEIGGSGGGHIRYLDDVDTAGKGAVYYQKLMKGRSVSCLFLAIRDVVEVVGFSEQWLDENNVEPFRYGGAVSHAEISAQAKVHFTNYVIQLSKAIGLVGLNSCDAICDGEDIYVLEINPRLSATIDLYSVKENRLLAMHIDACQNKLNDERLKLNSENGISKAHQIVYAKQDILIEQSANWPSWARDIPKVGSVFTIGMPICTVTAEGETSFLAKSLVQQRAVELNRDFLN